MNSGLFREDNKEGYDIKYQLKVSSSIFLIDHSE
jgi:hypothetical protein